MSSRRARASVKRGAGREDESSTSFPRRGNEGWRRSVSRKRQKESTCVSVSSGRALKRLVFEKQRLRVASPHGARPRPRRVGRDQPRGDGLHGELRPAVVHLGAFARVGEARAPAAAHVFALLQAIQDRRAAHRARRQGEPLEARPAVRRVRQALRQPRHSAATPDRSAPEQSVRRAFPRLGMPAVPRHRRARLERARAKKRVPV